MFESIVVLKNVSSKVIADSWHVEEDNLEDILT
jgi:hypothetical protein